MKSEAFSTCRLSHVTQPLRYESDTADKLEMNTIRSTEYGIHICRYPIVDCYLGGHYIFAKFHAAMLGSLDFSY